VRVVFVRCTLLFVASRIVPGLLGQLFQATVELQTTGVRQRHKIPRIGRDDHNRIGLWILNLFRGSLLVANYSRGCDTTSMELLKSAVFYLPYFSLLSPVCS
jgi:hypothetical protein